MKIDNYYVGLDIGTDSVGYAVTNETYDLCKYKGEPMWGVTLFDEAQTAEQRRGFRTSRRRLDRRQQRVQLVMDLFAKEICKDDPLFFKRIKESYKYPEKDGTKNRLFDSYESQKEYNTKYPTIHHLIVELMFNHFNLSCDLMEPFRVLVDRKVKAMNVSDFTSHEKHVIVDILNSIVVINQTKQTVLNAVKYYCRSVFDALNEGDLSLIRFYSL